PRVRLSVRVKVLSSVAPASQLSRWRETPSTVFSGRERSAALPPHSWAVLTLERRLQRRQPNRQYAVSTQREHPGLPLRLFGSRSHIRLMPSVILKWGVASALNLLSNKLPQLYLENIRNWRHRGLGK